MDSNDRTGGVGCLTGKVLITGASGFIGSNLSQRLSACGLEVHAISRIEHPKDSIGVRWWKGDLSDSTRIKSLLDSIKPEVIFHLAGYPVGSRDLNHVLPSLQNNLVSTVNLLTAATQVGCRKILLAGSLEEPSEDELAAVPSSPYAVAKWAGRAYANMFHALYKLPVTYLRIFMVYGPGRQDVKKLVPYVILSLLRKEAPKLTSGTRLVDWIYIGDVVDGIIAAAETQGLDGKTIDIGSGNAIAVRDLVDRSVKIVNTEIIPVFGILADRVMEQVRVADVARTQRLTGWTPKTSLDDGLRHTVDWFLKRLTSADQAV
jgi:UDP-glucose 4-epimerase